MKEPACNLHAGSFLALNSMESLLEKDHAP